MTRSERGNVNEDNLFHQGISGFADGIGRQKGYIETVEKLQTK
jgi:hypothetical protein